ncbi:MAG: hypothetical protein AAFU73_10225 [Planctomycetota bacterium]
MKSGSLLAVPAVLLGFVGGFFVRDALLGPPASAATRQAPTRSADPSTDVVRTGDGLDAVDAPDRALRTGSSSDDGGLVERDIARAVAATPRPEVDAPGTGSMSLVGKVYDKDGRPLAGVRVGAQRATSRLNATAEPASSARNERADNGIDLETALERAAERWAQQHADDRTSTTGDDGGFCIEGLPDAPFDVEATLEGWSFRMKTKHMPWAGGEPIEFEGTPLSAVRLDVVSADGSRIDEAILSVRPRGRNRTVKWTREDPVLRFEGDYARITAYADLFDDRATSDRGILARLVSDGVPVYAPPGEEVSARIELFPQAVLQGRVLGDTKIQRSVFARRLEAGEELERGVAVQDATNSWVNRGVFVMTLAPGRYAVGLLDDDSEPIDDVVIEVHEGWNEVVLQQSTVDLSRTIRVVSLAPSGTKLEGVDYEFEWRKNGGERDTEGMGVHRDIEGADLIEFDNFVSFDFEDWPSGTQMWLVGSHSAFGEARCSYAQGQTEATIQFVAPTDLVVELEGAEEGRPVTIQVMQVEDGEEDGERLASATRTSRSPRITGDGRAHFRGLTPGPVQVRVLGGANRWRSRGAELARRDITLGERDNRVRIQIPPAHALDVTLTPVTKSHYVRIRSREDDENEFFASRSTSDEGYVRFSHLPAGQYVLRDDRSGATLEVTVPTGPVAWNQSGHVTRLAVSISDAEGWLASQGLAGGDVIVAVDGEPYDPESDGLIELLLESGRSVTVEREEETFELELDELSQDVLDDRKLGGSIRVKR